MSDDWVLVQERFRNSFFPVYLVVEAMTGDMESLCGKSLARCVAVFEGPHVKWWIRQSDWNDIQAACFEKIKQDPAFIAKLIETLRQKAELFLAFTRSLETMEYKAVSNEQLWKLYESYCQQYRDVSLYGEPMALFTKDRLASYLEAQLKSKLVKIGKENRFADFFATLVSPTVPSFASREETELLGLAVKAKMQGMAAIENDLHSHTTQFFWLPYDYESDIWDTAHFKKTIEQLIRQPVTALEAQLEKQRALFVRLKQKQQQVASEVELDSNQLQLFSALRDCSQAMDYKKEVFTQSHWHKNALMHEIAKRLSIPFEQIYFVMQSEMKAALLHGSLDSKRLSERFELCFMDGQKGVTHLETDSIAVEWKRKFEQLEKEVLSKELQGVCACPGSALGRARVLLNASDISQMREGEILVTQATTPDFVPAMKKAAAIITNEGGITSHAAIVSRELGIPCIVGTQNATKRIQTGDLLDVHAASGTIKKIRQQNVRSDDASF